MPQPASAAAGPSRNPFARLGLNSRKAPIVPAVSGSNFSHLTYKSSIKGIANRGKENSNAISQFESAFSRNSQRQAQPFAGTSIAAGDVVSSPHGLAPALSPVRMADLHDVPGGDNEVTFTLTPKVGPVRPPTSSLGFGSHPIPSSMESASHVTAADVADLAVAPADVAFTHPGYASSLTPGVITQPSPGDEVVPNSPQKPPAFSTPVFSGARQLFVRGRTDKGRQAKAVKKAGQGPIRTPQAPTRVQTTRQIFPDSSAGVRLSSLLMGSKQLAFEEPASSAPGMLLLI